MPSLNIVAFAAEDPLSPRGERALAVAEAAARIADVELIGPTRAASLRARGRRLARAASPSGVLSLISGFQAERHARRPREACREASTLRMPIWRRSVS